MPAILIALRFVQFGGASILFGAASFFLYSPLLKGHAAPHWSGRLLAWAAAVLAVATPLGFVLQTADLAGSLRDAFEPTAWQTALLQMNFGKSSIVRLGCALAVLAAVSAIADGRRLWWPCAVLGAAICGSFAWMGHGAATEGARGWAHLVADIFHVLAAAGWIGALTVFCLALWERRNTAALPAALAAFSGVGSGLVATIVLTGIVNSAFLVGWNVQQAFRTAYGQVLAVKLVLFVLMLALAAANRFRLAPSLAGQPAPRDVALSRLRRSIGFETGFAFGVLALVSWLGTLPPVLQ